MNYITFFDAGNPLVGSKILNFDRIMARKGAGDPLGVSFDSAKHVYGDGSGLMDLSSSKIRLDRLYFVRKRIKAMVTDNLAMTKYHGMVKNGMFGIKTG